MIQQPPSSFPFLLEQLAKIPENTNYAESVLRGHVTGHVLTDCKDEPTVFLVTHPCGLTLLLGDATNHAASDALRAYFGNEGRFRRGTELVQAHPARWENAINTLMAGRIVDGLALRLNEAADADRKAIAREKVIRWGRLNFEFNREKFETRQRGVLEPGYRIERMGRQAFEWTEGAVIPKNFWNTAEDFERQGVAFAVFSEDKPVSVAFAAFVLPGRLEIGIETKAGFRGRGLAAEASAALVSYCLQQGLTPEWSCRKGNVGSQRIAQGLGFELSRELPYFALVE